MRRISTILLVLLLAFPLVVVAQQLPVIFVHGNGDSSALWTTTIWRFESAGYDRSLLFAIDLLHPNAPADDTKPTENRSTTSDQARQLAWEVAGVLLSTGQKKVVLVASSRGGNTIRNYLKNAGGSGAVAKAVLCGTPNHGVLNAKDVNLNNEFNGLGKFLTGLNAGSEVVAGVDFMTIRSDKNDKFAQPNGTGYASPELKGAKNVVIPGLDHRETAFSPQSFKAMYEFITGRPPASVEITPEPSPVLNGMVSNFVAGGYTNTPAAGVTVAIYEVDPATGQRRGSAVHSKTTGPDGLWGPFIGSPIAYYEFVYAGIHLYRTPFPRSSSHVGLRIRPPEPADAFAGSIVYLSRPRGYIGVGRDTYLVDGKVPVGVQAGVPTNDSARVRFPPGPQRSVPVVFNKEKLTVLTWPAAEGQVTIAEFHY